MKVLSKSASVIGVLLACLAAFWLWWIIAANYDYGALSGTYTHYSGTTRCVLQLNLDQTFKQSLETAQNTKHVSGTWHRSGMAGVDFSSSFLRLPGARTAIEEWPDSSPNDPGANLFYGHFTKILGIYPELEVNPNPPILLFHKCLFACPKP